MKAIFAACKALFPYLRLPPWSVRVLLALGLLTALTEGLSISLLIPLLQSASTPSVSRLAQWSSHLFGDLPPQSRNLMIGGILLAGVLLKNVFSYAYGCLFQWLNSEGNHQLRRGLVTEVLEVSQSYLDRQDSSRFLHVLNHETWRASAAFAVLASMLINSCVVAIFSVLLFAISWRLTLLTAAVLAGISWIIRTLTWRARKLGDRAAAANNAMTQRLLEIVSGLRLVRAFGREPYEFKRFDQRSAEVRRTFFHIDAVSGLVGPVSEMLALLLLVGIYFGAMRHAGTVAPTLAFLVLLYRLHPRLKQLDFDRVTLRSLSGAVEEVRAMLEKHAKNYLKSGQRQLPDGGLSMRFAQVSFQYDSSAAPALDEVSCLIPARKTTALVGPSGAGKSSIINLLCRFYDPTAGTIFVNDAPLPELDVRWWREQIALVSQEVHLFNATVAENIGYGNLEATRSAIIEAASQAHALDFIESLPQGFDTPIGERGLRLSGGQRQRLALARAFIREPRVLILDEATNALDVISEQIVQDALKSFGGRCTVIIAAHRFSTIEHADHVVVLEGGHLVEEGELRELRRAGGLFARLDALQVR